MLAILGLCAALGPTSRALAATEIFREDFEAPLDPEVWAFPTGDASFFGQTQIRPALPAVSDGVVRLRLDTHNPSDPVGLSFFGTDIFTLRSFERGQGLVLVARARVVTPMPRGTISAVFFYEYFPDRAVRDEIDFELLSKDLDDGRERVLTNVYSARGFGPGEGAGRPHFAALPGLRLDEFNIYAIHWLANRVEWTVNGVLVREERNENPDGPMRPHLNIWVPDASFEAAYDAGLEPAAEASQNQTFSFEVDYVAVQALPEPAQPLALAAALATLAALRRARGVRRI